MKSEDTEEFLKKANNRTITQKLIRKDNPVIYGYKLIIMEKTSYSIEIVL